MKSKRHRKWAGAVKRKMRYKARAPKQKHRSQHRKPVRTKVSKAQFIEALYGTGGIKATIAKRLGVGYGTVKRLLERPEWEDIREEYQNEVEAAVDEAEKTIRHAIRQRYDIPTAAKTACWYLSKIRRELYGDATKVTVEGGRRSLRMEHEVSHEFPLAKLPLKLKRKLLRAMEMV